MDGVVSVHLGSAPRCELMEARLRQWYDCNKDGIMAIAAAYVPKRPSTAVFRGKPWIFSAKDAEIQERPDF